MESLKEVLSEFLSYNGVKELLKLLADKKTILELMAIALIGKGFKNFWPQLTKVQLKKDFIQSLLDFKVRFFLIFRAFSLIEKIQAFFDSVKLAKSPSQKFFDLLDEQEEIKVQFQSLLPRDQENLELKLKENFYSISLEIYEDLMVCF